MLIVMKKGSTGEDLARVEQAVRAHGFNPHVISGAERVAIGITGNSSPIDPTCFENLPGVAQAIPISRPWKLTGREFQPADTVIHIGGAAIGRAGLYVIAGPCAVESEEQVLDLAHLLKAAGADALRGGAYKPRSSPYSFQGLGVPALEILARARAQTGLSIVTEAVDASSLEHVEAFADVIQIGARNMHNYELLKRAGKATKPVLLKRGMSATLEDFLLAAEYVMDAGNSNVILCERGIRTFSNHSRYTLDLSAIPALRDLSHLPLVVDPSHAIGIAERIPAMARAAAAAGADGVMIEVHPHPERSLSDSRQALKPEACRDLIRQMRELHAIVARRTETVR
jgi:3-deoxy-7-phosphoheptulonate synthase